MRTLHVLMKIEVTDLWYGVDDEEGKAWFDDEVLGNLKLFAGGDVCDFIDESSLISIVFDSDDEKGA